MATVAQTADRVVSVGEVIGGKYRVARFLGKGGMGEVVAAEHIDLRHEKAVKILLPAYTQHREILVRFKREAQIAANLRSPHAVKVHDYGEDQGRPYLVMELLDGVDLGVLVKRRGPLPEAEAIDYVLQACHALAEAHDSGIIHRDIKPANLFLAKQGHEKPCLKVLDFGIARLTDPRMVVDDVAKTRADSPLGSPRYMSPEHIVSAADADARSDIWSLGIVLYYLVSARWPFEGAIVEVIYGSILHENPKPIAMVRPDISPSLERIITKCLQKKPDARFQSIQELVNALGNAPVTSTTPVEIEMDPPTLTAPFPKPQPKVAPSEPLRSNLRRRMIVGGVAAVVCFSLMFGVVVLPQRQTVAELQHIGVDIIPTVALPEQTRTENAVMAPPPIPTQAERVSAPVAKKNPVSTENRTRPSAPEEFIPATAAPEENPAPPPTQVKPEPEPPPAPKPVVTAIVTTSVAASKPTTTQKAPELMDDMSH